MKWFFKEKFCLYINDANLIFFDQINNWIRHILGLMVTKSFHFIFYNNNKKKYFFCLILDAIDQVTNYKYYYLVLSFYSVIVFHMHKNFCVHGLKVKIFFFLELVWAIIVISYCMNKIYFINELQILALFKNIYLRLGKIYALVSWYIANAI